MFLTILFTLASFSASITKVLMVVVVTVKATRGGGSGVKRSDGRRETKIYLIAKPNVQYLFNDNWRKKAYLQNTIYRARLSFWRMKTSTDVKLFTV